MTMDSTSEKSTRSTKTDNGTEHSKLETSNSQDVNPTLDQPESTIQSNSNGHQSQPGLTQQTNNTDGSAEKPSMEPTTILEQWKALIVDDNANNREIFRYALTSVGYSVDEEEDGLKGLAALEGNTYDLLVLDLQMPGMDGRSVLSKVKSNPLFAALRVVVVTANAHMATDDITDSADYVMFKPINVIEFSEFARRLKNSRSVATTNPPLG